MSAIGADFPALREWSSTCGAIARGEQCLLIRKGGISEPEFEIESRKFALLPTVFHQKGAGESPAEVVVSVVSELVKAVEVPSTASMDDLSRFHRYESQQLETRLRYKPEKPLTLMAIRSYHLRPEARFSSDVIRPVCRSWHGLPLDLSEGGGRGLEEIHVAGLDELVGLLNALEVRYAG